MEPQSKALQALCGIDPLAIFIAWVGESCVRGMLRQMRFA